jgi:CheY-like chemotaxis protein
MTTNIVDLSTHSILVIDDEPDNLELLETALHLIHGATVRVASSADAALAQLDSFTPTMVISDISMPRVDGYQLLLVFRQRPKTKELPIIALTAHAMRGDRDRILEAGFDGYISKPFEVGTIAEQIVGLLSTFAVRQKEKIVPLADKTSDLSTAHLASS